MERALLVTVNLETEKDSWSIEDSAQELEELVASCDVDALDNITCRIKKPTPNLLIGKGKAEEIALICQEENIGTVIFSHDLSGTQQRNLEEVIGVKTIDRTQLILDIFARHARSPEGKIQVELAQLEYLLPRLVGKGIMLSRLGGGIGTRGPGEQKLEVDRRHIRRKIEKLKQDLKNISLHRKTLRKRREEKSIPQVVLVGYTNAGKSTLLNALTEAGQIVKDSLFTTLDPLAKGLRLPNGEDIVLSDTVGFLHNLPHHLIEAFKATLEEVQEADLLIHVLDVSNHLVYEYNKAVIGILKELNSADKPIVVALNKIDLFEDETWLAKIKDDFPHSVLISAQQKINLEILLSEIQRKVAGRMDVLEAVIPYARMDLLDLFHREGKVISKKFLAKGIKVKVNLPKSISSNLLHNKAIDRIN